MPKNKFIQAFLLVAILFTVFSPVTFAQTDRNFSLQVTPSPLVLSMKPGESVTSELKIRNNGDKTELLKIEPRSFNINGDTGEVALSDGSPTDIASWISFADPKFSIEPGQWFTQRITISLPKEAGFSYSFALVISRALDAPAAKPGETSLKGSVAVFTLIAVDRPGAKRQVEVTDFFATKRVYEYLPAELTTTLKNTGNTIVQPYGNIFIQRSASNKNPIATLPVNEGKGYILPGSSRTLTTAWDDGFPVYQTKKDVANSTPKNSLSWHWNKLSSFRIGRYTAKLVAVYNDGNRDVPIEAQTTFWVVPWKLLLGAFVVVGLLLVGLFTLFKKSFMVVKRTKKNHDQADGVN